MSIDDRVSCAKTSELSAFIETEIETARVHFQEAINTLHAFITHNSTASVDSCVRGIPTFVTSDLAICWPVANTNLEDIENPKYPERDQWVYDIGYKQWTEEEIKNGTVFKRFKERLKLK